MLDEGSSGSGWSEERWKYEKKLEGQNDTTDFSETTETITTGETIEKIETTVTETTKVR